MGCTDGLPSDPLAAREIDPSGSVHARQADPDLDRWSRTFVASSRSRTYSAPAIATEHTGYAAMADRTMATPRNLGVTRRLILPKCSHITRWTKPCSIRT